MPGLSARGADQDDAREERRDQHHDDVLRRRHVEREAADHDRRPVRQVHDLEAGRVEPRNVELVASR